MNLEEFDTAYRAARDSNATTEELPDITLFDLLQASESDIDLAESFLNVRLPELYKEFMRSYGGGQFLFLDILAVTSTDPHVESLLDVNRPPFFDGSFVAVAPVGTGDWWGFKCADGVCEDAVSFQYHEDKSVEDAAPDFLEFVASRGLQVDE